MDRRKFIKMSTGLVAASAATKLSISGAQEAHQAQQKTAAKGNAATSHDDAMNKHAALLGGEKLTIAMLVYPGMYLQDLVGPLTVFESLMNRDIHLVWKNTEPVGNENPNQPKLIPVRPTMTFKDCPKNLDVLFVPGGVPGTLTMMQDQEVLDFLAEQAKTARYITSVCTGSLILGAAGLLKGYQATTYWSLMNVLPELDAIPVNKRIVIDRNRVTGGGVTAGIDFGLKLVALLRNEAYAKAVQLYLEYNPEPPFDAGTPEKAPAEVKLFLDEMFAELNSNTLQVAKKAKKRLG